MGLQNILESKEVKEKISSISFNIYWTEESANFKIDINDNDGALGALHRLNLR
jgi:hypothetical protein